MSKIYKIAELISIKGLTDFIFVIIQLCKSLSVNLSYVVYTDNFFSYIKLFITLKKLKINACNTAKAESDCSVLLLRLKKTLFKKKDWGTTVCTVSKNVLVTGQLSYSGYPSHSWAESLLLELSSLCLLSSYYLASVGSSFQNQAFYNLK